MEEKVYRCCNCNLIFSEDELLYEESNENGCYENDYGVADQFENHTYYNKHFEGYVCPYCNSDKYDEGVRCKKCGKFIDSFDDTDICDDCYFKDQDNI